MDAGGSPVPELLCHEGESYVGEEEEGNATVEDACSSSGFAVECSAMDGEALEGIVKREMMMDEWKGRNDAVWDKCARSDAIRWIFKIRTTLGFRLQTAYLSVLYFDRFLARRAIDSGKAWAFRLLSIACLSLAAKMEEIRVPSLTEYQSEEYNFGSENVQKMELFVLTTLEWKLLCVSPFAFLSHFQVKLSDGVAPRDFHRNASGLIVGLMRESNLLLHRPSAIAAAAVAAATDRSLTSVSLETKMEPIAKSGFPRTWQEDVRSCYEVMRVLDMEETLTALDSSHPSRAKRRRLRFT